MCTHLYDQVEGVIAALAGARGVRAVDEQADDAPEALYANIPVWPGGGRYCRPCRRPWRPCRV